MIYEKSPDSHTEFNHLECLLNLSFAYKADIYFYARYFLMNMDYKLFCDNYFTIYMELIQYMEKDILESLLNEVVTGLSSLRNEQVDERLDKLFQEIKDKEECQ